MDSNNSPKNVNPFIGLILFFTSVILLLTTGTLGLIYGVFVSLYRGYSKLGNYLLQIAVSIDELGNVIMQQLFNHLLIRKNGYKFGNNKETISSVIGRNVKRKTLTKSGQLLNKTLNFFDEDHALNSIDYRIEVKPHHTKK